MANRHGLITGATGTGKTVTLQRMAESFSAIGVPVFMADVKGDLSGISQPGQMNPKLKERLDSLKLPAPEFAGCPVTFWDVFGEQGSPVRGTVSELGPLLLSRMLDLNDTQEGVLTLVFKVCDDNGLLLLDLKDLRAALQFIGDNAKQFTTQYGNVSAASIGAIQRGLLTLEQQGGDKFFGEPALNVADLMQTDKGRGVINILAADKLMQQPRIYATFLLWMLSELYAVSAGGGRPGQTQAGVLLRRSAPAVHRRTQGAAGQDRTGGAPDPLQGRRRLLRDARTRWTSPTPCWANWATACSTRCARSRRAIRRRCRPPPPPCAPTRS